MKILFTPPRYYPYLGGVERSSYHLATHLAQLGETVKVVCALDGPGEANEIIEKVKINRLRYFIKVAGTAITPSLPYRLAKEDYEIVQTYMPTPWSADWSILIGKLRRKKSVIYIKNDMGHSNKVAQLILKCYLQTLFRLSLHLTDKIFIVNQEWEDVFHQTRKVLKKHAKKVVVIPNGVDVNKFSNGGKNIKRHKNEILFISVFSKYHQFKGLDDLLIALVNIKKNIPDIKLRIAGDGELRPFYEQLVIDLGLSNHVEFLGKFPQHELKTLYMQASLFVLPSRGFEGHANVVLEALACGTPVVVSNVVGMVGDIENQNCGFVIEPSMPTQISEKVITLLRDDKLRSRMSKNALRLIQEKYRWEAVANSVLAEYKGILGVKKARSSVGVRP